MSSASQADLPVDKLSSDPEAMEELPESLFDLSWGFGGPGSGIPGQDLNAVDSVALLHRIDRGQLRVPNQGANEKPYHFITDHWCLLWEMSRRFLA